MLSRQKPLTSRKSKIPFFLGGLAALLVISLLLWGNPGNDTLTGIDSISAEPSSFPVNTQTLLTITTQIQSPTLIPDSVTLTISNDGIHFSLLGQMYDDGTHGDRVPSDNIFTTELLLKESSTRTFFLRSSAAFRGIPRRATSEPLAVHIYDNAVPEEVLSSLAGSLRKGDVEAALTAFSDTDSAISTRDFLAGLDNATLQDLGNFFEQATLIEDLGTTRIYVGPHIEDDGSVSQVEFIMSRSPTGQWRITSW